MIYKDYYRAQKGSGKHAASRWLIDKLLFFLKQKPKDIPINKILIIANGHLGDCIMSTSIFREIKKTYPEIKIDVLTTPVAKQLIEKNPYINKIITAELFWRKETRNWKIFKEYLSLIKQLKKEKYDLGIAVRSDLPNILTLWLAKIPNRVAFFNLDGGKPFLTNPILYPEQEQHASIADLNLINRALNMKATDNFPEIFIDEEDICFANSILNEMGVNKYICICPGACAKLQRWDKEKFAEIIKWFEKDYPDYHVILAGGNEDKELIEELSLNNSKCIKIINFNLRILKHIFKNASCVLVQDGGCQHLCYANLVERGLAGSGQVGYGMEMCGNNMVTLWSCNPLAHVAPLRGKIIHHRLPCYPCMRREKECKKPEGKRCMDLISVDEVKMEISNILNRKLFKE